MYGVGHNYDPRASFISAIMYGVYKYRIRVYDVCMYMLSVI